LRRLVEKQTPQTWRTIAFCRIFIGIVADAIIR
jgi:hypothetical protein